VLDKCNLFVLVSHLIDIGDCSVRKLDGASEGLVTARALPDQHCHEDDQDKEHTLAPPRALAKERMQPHLGDIHVQQPSINACASSSSAESQNSNNLAFVPFCAPKISIPFKDDRIGMTRHALPLCARNRAKLGTKTVVMALRRFTTSLNMSPGQPFVIERPTLAGPPHRASNLPRSSHFPLRSLRANG
jgi:hypothetical protein